MGSFITSEDVGVWGGERSIFQYVQFESEFLTNQNLTQMCKVLTQVCRVLTQMCRVLTQVCRVLTQVCRVLTQVCGVGALKQ